MRQSALGFVLALTAVVQPAATQFGQPAVTTSFADADPTIHLPDDFSPEGFRPLSSAPTAPDRGYLLAPGAYRATVQSFCLHAGTYAPSKGEGYLYAPLKGARADIVRALLRGVPDHPAIAQSDVQTLIWAIEANMTVFDLAPAVRQAAEVMLSAADIALLNTNRLQTLLDPGLALARLPPQVRELLETQGALRNLLANPQARFAEIERLAVRYGMPPGNGTDIPRGRWSSHPSGAFVRYLPESYSTTTMEIYVPPEAGAVNRPVEFDPGGDVAVPANTSRQRLGMASPGR